LTKRMVVVAVVGREASGARARLRRVAREEKRSEEWPRGLSGWCVVMLWRIERRVRCGRRAARTSAVPSGELPSTMERKQEEGLRWRMAERMLLRRRGRTGRQLRRSRAMKYWMGWESRGAEEGGTAREA